MFCLLYQLIREENTDRTHLRNTSLVQDTPATLAQSNFPSETKLLVEEMKRLLDNLDNTSAHKTAITRLPQRSEATFRICSAEIRGCKREQIANFCGKRLCITFGAEAIQSWANLTLPEFSVAPLNSPAHLGNTG